MYSGITQGLFPVTHVLKKPGLTQYAVQLNEKMLAGLSLGASLAIDGVCQTVTAIQGNDVSFDAIAETLQKTTLSDLHVGQTVSVETSLRYGDPVGGHEMAGHVIGTLEVAAVKTNENNLDLTLACPPKWLKYIFTKGFVSIDGSSLTVGEIDKTRGTFTLHIIPETLRLTHFADKRPGDKVNLELDFKTQAIVQTVERVLQESCKT